MAKQENKNMDTEKVQKCLRGVSYPASKGELIQHAQNTCGDEEVVSMLKDLPEETYGTATDLTQVLGGVLGGGIHLKLDI